MKNYERKLVPIPKQHDRFRQNMFSKYFAKMNQRLFSFVLIVLMFGANGQSLKIHECSHSIVTISVLTQVYCLHNWNLYLHKKTPSSVSVAEKQKSLEFAMFELQHEHKSWNL